MCLSAPRVSYNPLAAQPTPVAAYDNAQAQAQASLEARLRRARAGAAADVLTGPLGIPSARAARPSTPVLGGVAQ